MATQRNIDLYKILGIDDKARKKRTKRIGAALWSRWAGMVRGLPTRYRKAYRGAMRLSVKGSQVTLALDADKLVRSVEYGFGPGGVGTSGPYDMRKTLLTSPAAKMGRSGKYLAVPMNMPTRKMRGGQGGERAYRMARQLTASVMSTGGGKNTRWGGGLPRGLTSKLRSTGRTVPGIGFQPAHATDPTHGTRRFVPRAGGGAKYGSFRTISQRGKPWVHPGIKAHRFIRKVARMVPAVVKEVG